MYMRAEKEITEAILYIARRHWAKYMKNYKENEKSKYLICLDMRSFYANLGSKYLLISELRWLTDK